MTFRHVAKLYALTVVGLIGLCFGVAYVGYQGRVDVVSSQRAACLRGKADRADEAAGRRIDQHRAVADGDYAAAAGYGAIAARLQRRAGIDCDRVYPKPSLIP